MLWPADHPALVDPALRPWADAAAHVVPDGRCIRVLRHLAGRRVASQVALGGSDGPDGPTGVLKVFASPRGRGNDRRLRALAAAGMEGLVPDPWGVDRSGHVQLVSFIDGVVFDDEAPDRFVASARMAGRLAARLHGCGAELDRSWTWHDEVALLTKRATPTTRSAVEDVVARTAHLADEPLVSAHRDCHPKQMVRSGERASWIDLDDAAMAPPTLDVGNLIAHLLRDAALARRSEALTGAAVAAVLDGYGPVRGDLDAWIALALVRLAGLAESRHGAPDDARRILELDLARCAV